MKTQKNKCAPALLAFVLLLATLAVDASRPALSRGSSAREIDREATQSLANLFTNTPDAKVLADKAVAVLVFPRIVKGGFIIGGQFGDGALMPQ